MKASILAKSDIYGLTSVGFTPMGETVEVRRFTRDRVTGCLGHYFPAKRLSIDQARIEYAALRTMGYKKV